MIYSYACYLLVEFCAQNINVPCTCYTAHHVRATLRTMYVLSRTYMYVITDQVIVNDLSGILFVAFVIAPAFNIKQCSFVQAASCVPPRPRPRAGGGSDATSRCLSPETRHPSRATKPQPSQQPGYDRHKAGFTGGTTWSRSSPW